MSAHRTISDLNRALNVLAASDTGAASPVNVNAPFIYAGSAAPANGVAGYAVGALFIDNATGDWYVNNGTTASTTWKATSDNTAVTRTMLGALTVTGVLTASSTSTLTGAVTMSAGGTVSANQTLAVTTADKLTVNSIIVPQFFHVSVHIGPSTATAYHLFYADRAYQVTALSMTPSVAHGSAMTGTICKATGTSAPVKTTTPMHAADALDFNATAHTVQAPTLTVTTADLQLAVTNKIGVVLSAAMTTGSACIDILLKAI